MATGEVHVQLAVNYASNRRVRALKRYGREARAVRDLYVQMVCHCKAMMTDGFVADDEIAVLVLPDPEKIGMRDAARLADVGLVERCDGGWLVIGYLERNPSKADVLRRAEAKAAGARLANHRRWHIEEGISDPRCILCQKTDQITDPSSDQKRDQSPDSDRVGTDSGSESTESETDSETESETETDASDDARKPECGSDDDPEFRAFWSAYPKKVSKGQARKAWRAAIRTRHEEPAKLILAAEQYADDCRRKRTERKYILNPASWLNGESYDDKGDDDGQESGGRIHYPDSPWAN